MAGIITDFKNDIQRLQDIKKAIADVKNELKSINIKVDIDIAKGLEARLKSLTTQYDVLVRKIGEAEGKIMLSTRKINDVSRKIIQTQEKLSKSTGGIAQPGNQGIVSGNVAEMTNIHAQAKAYDELRDEIDKVIGTRSQNIKRMIEETNAIRLINAEIKEITKSQGVSASLSSAQQKRLEQLNNSLLTHKTALSEVRQALNNNVKLDNAAATSMNGLSESLSRMRITYRELTEEERNSPFGRELLASINQADAKIKELDATIGNHQRNVGNYASGFNGLNMSVQQIVRELPAATMGLNMFFLAISNNLPILTDEIKRAKAANEELKRSGNTGIPVWKQLAKSLFSWQSVMMVGITLLSVYGKEIGNWVGSLFSAEKALSETYQKTEEFQKKVGNTSGSTLATLEKLSIGWKRLGKDINAQKKYILDNKDAIDSMGVSVTNVAEAERLFNTNKDAFIQGIIQRAQAAATMELASEEYKKSVQKMLEADAKAKEGVDIWDKLKSFFAKAASAEDLSGSLLNADLSPEAFAREKENDLRKKADKHKKSTLDLIYRAMGIDEESRKKVEEAGGKLTETIIEGSVKAIEATIALKREALKNVTDKKDYARIEAEIQAEQNKLDAITGQKDVIAEKIQREHEKQQLENAKRLIDQADELEQQRINLLADGAEKERDQRELDHKKALQQIDREREELREKQIEAARQLYNDNSKNKKGTFYQSQEYKNARILTKSDQDYFLKKEANENARYAIAPLLEIEQRYADERLEIEKKFNKDIADLREEREKAEKDGDAYRILKIDSLTNKVITEKGKSLLSYDLEKFKASPEYVKAFENLGNISEETLKHLLSKLEEYKQKAAETLDPAELREYTSTLEKIQEEINNRDIFGTLARQKREVTDAYRAFLKAERELNAARGTGKEEQAQENYRIAKDRLIKANNEYIESESEAIAKTQELISALRGIGDVVGDEAGNVINLISNIASFALTSMEGVKTASTSASTAVRTVEKASVILGIIGAAIQLIQQINTLLPDAYSQYEKYAEKIGEMNKLTDAVHEYKMAVLEAQRVENGWFAEDRLKELRDLRKENEEVNEAYFDKLFESQAIYQNKTGNGWLTRLAHWTNPATWFEKMGLPDWLSKTTAVLGSGFFGLEGTLGQIGLGALDAAGGKYEYEKGQTAAINNLRIETRKAKKGFLGTGIGGKSQKTEDLASWLKKQKEFANEELFDEKGFINTELANTVLEKYGDKLVGETKATLESLVELKKKYEEYKEQLHEYVSSLYEPLVDNFVDSIWDWFDSGKDALTSFKDYASDVFRDIVSDMLRTLVLNKVIDGFDDKITDLYDQYSEGKIDEQKLMQEVAKQTSDLMNRYKGQLPVLQDMLTAIDENLLSVTGMDLKDDSASSEAQTATQRGYDTMSQDTASELNGRFTALQMAGEEIKAQNIQQTETMSILSLKADSLLYVGTDIRNIADETRSILANSYLELRQISDNTGAIITPINEMNDKLEKIQRNTENL